MLANLAGPQMRGWTRLAPNAWGVVRSTSNKGFSFYLNRVSGGRKETLIRAEPRLIGLIS